MMTLSAEKTALLKCISYTASKEISVHRFWATRLIITSKEAEWSALQKYREFYPFFEFKKIKLMECENFYGKMNFVEDM